MEEIKDNDINIDQIIKCGHQFLNDLNGQKDINVTRYRSWEHCYKKFKDSHNKKNLTDAEKDELCLNLAFYLASWGMYRGSSFLLDFDYKVHKDAVEEILKDEYNKLWEFDVSKYKLETINALKAELEKIYEPYRNNSRKFRKSKAKSNEISDTLITKIILGTIGCTPAFDRYFSLALKKIKGDTKLDNFQYLKEFYQRKNEFEVLRRKIAKERGFDYPPMKVLDMCLWQLGKNMYKENN